jgi:hypothetical protein
MAANAVVGSSVTANQLKDLFRQIADGSLTGDHIQAFLEHRKPFASPENMIFRRVYVDRSKSLKEALHSIGRNRIVPEEIVVPKGKGKDVPVYLFRIGHERFANEVDRDVQKLGFQLADPYTLIALNAAEPGFADKYPNATQWSTGMGYSDAIAFSRHENERRVTIHERCAVWSEIWWFALIHK